MLIQIFTKEKSTCSLKRTFVIKNLGTITLQSIILKQDRVKILSSPVKHVDAF